MTLGRWQLGSGGVRSELASREGTGRGSAPRDAT